jgi:lauroyl/myristoyl acyltransferase
MLPFSIGITLAISLGFAQASTSPSPSVRGARLSFRSRVALATLAITIAIVLAVLSGASTEQICGSALILGAAGQTCVAMQRRKWGEITLDALRAAYDLAVALIIFEQWLTPAWRAGLIGVALILGFRMLRKAGVILALRLGQDMARGATQKRIEHFRQNVTPLVRNLPPLRWRLATNMRRAGVYRRERVDMHVERAVEQMTMLMQVMQAGFPGSSVAERFELDDSVRHLHAAHAAGHGVLAVSPHLCAYPVFPRMLADYVPCSIYLRRGESAGKNTVNTLIGEAGGGHLVHPPDNASPLEHLTVAMRVLRDKRVLYITPDLPRKPDEGVPVTIWGRRVYFPTGVILMAMRTQAPVVFCTWYHDDGIYHVSFDEPLTYAARGDRRRTMGEGMQHFAQRMNAFLHAHPEMWWNWLDKRWTRILRAPRGPDTQPGMEDHTSRQRLREISGTPAL